jgi:uncharacterized membrane protein YfcA
MAMLAYVALGAAAGTLAGLLGVGGGLVVVPVLLWVFTAEGFPSSSAMHLAVGTSLGAILFTAVSSALAHHRRGAVDWRVVAALSPGVVVGTALGVVVADSLSSRGLRTFFGLFELLAASYMVADVRPRADRGLPGPLGMAAAGSVIGAVSALAGIGGGTMTVPLLVWFRTGIRAAVATSAAVGIPVALAGAIGHALAGGGAELPPASLGYLYLPALLGLAATSVAFAPVGASLAHRLPTTALRRVFALFLFLVGLRMLAG